MATRVESESEPVLYNIDKMEKREFSSFVDQIVREIGLKALSFLPDMKISFQSLASHCPSGLEGVLRFAKASREMVPTDAQKTNVSYTVDIDMLTPPKKEGSFSARVLEGIGFCEKTIAIIDSRMKKLEKIIGKIEENKGSIDGGEQKVQLLREYCAVLKETKTTLEKNRDTLKYLVGPEYSQHVRESFLEWAGNLALGSLFLALFAATLVLFLFVVVELAPLVILALIPGGAGMVSLNELHGGWYTGDRQKKEAEEFMSSRVNIKMDEARAYFLLASAIPLLESAALSRTDFFRDSQPLPPQTVC